jgi:predicted metal-dependent hydrolase
MEYQWIRSKRKSMTIQIKAHGQVIVRTPYRVSKRTVEQFLYAHQTWILEKQHQVIAAEAQQVHITGEERKQGIELAKKLIPERVAYFAKQMDVTYGRITIREQKTRWGSCSSKGNLNFNWKLVLFEPELLDYVVVHELAHRIEMNHSANFWIIVESVLPDYKERRKRLREKR